MFRFHWPVPFVAILLVASLAACGRSTAPGSDGATSQPGNIGTQEPVALAEGEQLRVVATIDVLGDVVRRIGGNRIDLAVLLEAGDDPHSYTATPQEMALVADADLLFVNGVGLEESLFPTLESVEGPVIVTVNEGVPILEGRPEHASETAAEHDEQPQGDPHTWLSVQNVILWAHTVGTALATADPANADTYRAAADDYAAELAALDAELRAALDAIPQDRRKLVTDHASMNYFAHDYGFKVVGVVIPSFNTLATISARAMAALQEQIAAEGVRAIFVDTTVNPRLAEQLATDAGVRLVRIYTGSMGAPGSGASTYVEMMRSNVAAIVDALR